MVDGLNIPTLNWNIIVFNFIGGLLLSVQDSAVFEDMDQVTQPDVMSATGSDTTSNLLSSGTVISQCKLWMDTLTKNTEMQY